MTIVVAVLWSEERSGRRNAMGCTMRRKKPLV
jgi:hypothetical protein